MAAFSQSYNYRDDKGQTGSVRMFIIADTQADAEPLASDIADAIDAMTNAHHDSSIGAFTSVAGDITRGTDALYERIEDKAVMEFRTTAGAVHKYQIPAPKGAIFMTDGETVDQTNGLVTTFVTAMLAGAGSRDGVALGRFVGGVLGRVPLRRKFSIETRNPSLTGPGL